MRLPKPHPGLVVRELYLWHAEHETGREEGTKDRPCAVVLAVADADGRERVTVLPITHVEPKTKELAVEIPAVVKQRLGLDAERSWIVIETKPTVSSGPAPIYVGCRAAISRRSFMVSCHRGCFRQ